METEFNFINPAPIVLFIYNRPEHTRRVLNALSENFGADQSELYVFADGPKEGASTGEINIIEETRNVIKEKKWCKKVHLIKRDKNMNLEDNVIDGITTVLEKYEKVIVLEDDVLCSPYFLKYCNDGLQVYEENKQIYSINAFMFPIDYGGTVETFLLPLATSSWGWATWRDRWQKLELQINYAEVIYNNEFLSQRFNLANYSYTNLISMNTWDIRWYYTAFLRNGLGVFPTETLVKNIGFDYSGTHNGHEDLIQDIYLGKILHKPQDSISINHYLKYLQYFTKYEPKPIFLRRIFYKLKLIINCK